MENITLEELKQKFYVKLDDRPITDAEWERYHKAYNSWLNTDYGSDMARAMSKPNAPNQKYSNNH